MVGTLRFAHPTALLSQGRWEYESAFSRRDSPEVLQIPCPHPPNRGRRESRVPTDTRGLVCQTHSNRRTRAYRFSRNSPAFPTQWLYGLLRALPGERAFLPPSPAGYLPPT